MFFNQYPYMNLNDFNLDYILKTLKLLSERLENFIALNTIKYANPIQWNITTQYESNTVVIDANDGTAYLSVKPVPTGVAITNTDYWTPIFTLNLLSANQNITFRDDGANVLATFASDIDDWLIWNNTLYKVSRAIAINEAYVVGYNLTRYSVELFLSDALTAVNATIVSLSDKINERQNYITPKHFGAVGDGVTDDTTAIQSAIEYAANNRIECKFDTATYLISAPIEITAPVFINGQYAIITTNASISSVFEIDIPNPIPAYGRGVLKNVFIKCNYKATSGIEIKTNINAITLEHIQINDALSYGIYGNTGTIVLTDCMIRNTSNSYLNVVGIYCGGSDNEIIGYMAVNCRKSLVINGLSRIERNTSWNSFAELMTTSLFAEVNANCEFIDCMIDTWATGIDGSGFLVRLTNCTYFWNPQYYTDASVGDSTTRPYLFGDNLQGAILNGVRVFRASGRSVTTSLFTPTQKNNYLYNVAFKNVLDGVLNVPTITPSSVTHTLAGITATTNDYTVINTPTGRHYHVSIVGTLSAAATDRTPIITAINADHRPNGEVIGRAFVGLYSGDLVPVLWDNINNRFVLITPTGVTYAANTNVWIEIEYDL